MAGNNSGNRRSDFPAEGWKRSSFSSPNGGDCLEVNDVLREQVGLRDSKQPSGTVLIVTPQRWSVFLTAVRCGEFDQ